MACPTVATPGRAVVARKAPEQSNPFFIFGCPRSGTSLLSRMLASHPRLAVPYESHLYDNIFPIVQGHTDSCRQPGRARLVSEILRTEPIRRWTPPPSLPDTLAAIQRDGFHGIVEGLMSAWAAGQGKSRWGEKTPQHTFWWRAISAGFPRLQVIHLVRDGRDVALSYRAAHFGPKHVYPLARRWRNYLVTAEEARATLGDQVFLQVRYEDLVTQPERELRRICHFLGEEFAPSMLTFHHGQNFHVDQRNAQNLRRPVMSDNMGKWRTGLTSREVRIFEALAGTFLERYGYPRAVTYPHVSAWEALCCRYFEHPPRRFSAMLKNRDGYRLALEKVRLRVCLSMG
jgi:sulfotransferase family protein